RGCCGPRASPLPGQSEQVGRPGPGGRPPARQRRGLSVRVRVRTAGLASQISFDHDGGRRAGEDNTGGNAGGTDCELCAVGEDDSECGRATFTGDAPWTGDLLLGGECGGAHDASSSTAASTRLRPVRPSPPQIPFFSPRASAELRQSVRTGHPWQISIALLRSVLDSEKNRSVSSPPQAASFCQPVLIGPMTISARLSQCLVVDEVVGCAAGKPGP